MKYIEKHSITTVKEKNILTFKVKLDIFFLKLIIPIFYSSSEQLKEMLYEIK